MKRGKAILGATAILAATGSIILGVDRHYSHKFNERYNNYVNGLFASMQPVSFDLSWSERAAYVRQVESRERRFDELSEEFKRFVEEKKRDIGIITNDDTEYSGNIRLNVNGFYIEKPSQEWRAETIKYLQQALDDSFTNKDTLKLYLTGFGSRMLLDQKKTESALMALDILESLDKYRHMSYDEITRAGTIDLPSPNGRILKIPLERLKDQRIVETLQKYEEGSRNLLTLTLELIKDNVPISLPNEPNVYAIWHSHPRDMAGYEPSEPDKVTSYITGPSVVFAQTGNILHVFGINHGQSREIYTTGLK